MGSGGDGGRGRRGRRERGEIIGKRLLVVSLFVARRFVAVGWCHGRRDNGRLVRLARGGSVAERFGRRGAYGGAPTACHIAEELTPTHVRERHPGFGQRVRRRAQCRRQSTGCGGHRQTYVP